MKALKRDRKRFHVGTTERRMTIDSWIEYLEIVTVSCAFIGGICTIIGLFVN